MNKMNEIFPFNLSFSISSSLQFYPKSIRDYKSVTLVPSLRESLTDPDPIKGALDKFEENFSAFMKTWKPQFIEALKQTLGSESHENGVQEDDVQEDALVEFEQEKGFQNQLQTQPADDSIVSETGDHEALLVKLEDQLDHGKVISLPISDSSSPKSVANTARGMISANQKEHHIAAKVFDENPERDGYIPTLNPKPPDKCGCGFTGVDSFRLNLKSEELYYESEIETMKPNKSNTIFMDFSHVMSFYNTHPIKAVKFFVSPVVRVEVQCKVESDLPKLVEELKQVAKATNSTTGDGTTCVPLLTKARFAARCKSVTADVYVMDEGQNQVVVKFSGCMQLGDTYALLGQLENSILYYAAGLEIQNQVLGKKHPRFGETYRYVAEAHVQILQFHEDEKLCQKALGYVVVDCTGCNANEDINFQFTGVKISRIVVGTVGGENCSHKNGSPSNVNVEFLFSISGITSSVLTSINGSYSFTNIIPVKYNLRAAHRDLTIEGKGSKEVELGYGDGVIADSFFVPGYDIRELVVAQRNPILGVHIYLYSDDVSEVDYPQDVGYAPGLSKAPCHAISDAEVMFAFKSIPCGVYKLIPYYKGEYTVFDVLSPFLSASVQYDRAIVPQKFQVTGFSVGGRVIAGNNRGVDSVKIIVDGHERTITDKKRYYKLDKVTSKRYTIEAKNEHYRFDKLLDFKVLPNMASVVDIKAFYYEICGLVHTVASSCKAEACLAFGTKASIWCGKHLKITLMSIEESQEEEHCSLFFQLFLNLLSYCDAGAPLLGAGITMYSPMKCYGMTELGMHLSMVGLGGFGHVAVKFGKVFGLEVTVINTSPKKEAEAISKLGDICHARRRMQTCRRKLNKDLGQTDWAFCRYPKFLGILYCVKIFCIFQLANLSEEVKKELEDPYNMYNFGWSHGKAKLESGKPKILKGSFYANPILDVPTAEESLIHRYVSKGMMLCVDEGLEQILLHSGCHKGRLLYYFPVEQSNYSQEGDSMSSWYGWHTDHRSLTSLTCGMFMRDAVETPYPDGTAGLYIKTRYGQIVKVVYGEDEIAYQIGETTKILSRGHLCATPHCVRAPKGEEAFVLNAQHLHYSCSLTGMKSLIFQKWCFHARYLHFYPP